MALFDSSVGVPLFWQERKTVKCWKAILKDVQCKAVFDLTPGSGACARAAMEMGVPYAGVTRCQEHCSWLQNILDRQALRCVATAGALFDQDLSECVKEHFQDVLDQLNEQDAIEDTDPMEE